MRPLVRAREAQDSSQQKRCPRCGAMYPIDFKVCPKDGTGLEMNVEAEEDGMLGDVLGGAFCIVGVVGEGGMGRVYEAEHVRLPRKFAVKVIAPELANNAEAIARLEREAQAAASIVHPNILDVVDVVRGHDGRPCMVTELLEGEELGMLIHRTQGMPMLDAIDVCRQACRGLGAAHAKGIVHRDLKPSNIFLCKADGPGYRVKILDFGVAKMRDGAQLTRFGTVVGTPAYMAPEQARGAPDVDARADVYGVGAVLFHLLAGRPPFDEDEDPSRTLARVVMEEPRRLRELNPNVPPELEAIVMRAIAKAPTSRIASAADLERELGGFVKALEARAAAAAAAAAPASQPQPPPQHPNYGPPPSFVPGSRGAPTVLSRPAAQLPSQARSAAVVRAVAGVVAAAFLVLAMELIAHEVSSKTKGPSFIWHVMAMIVGAGVGVGLVVVLDRTSR